MARRRRLSEIVRMLKRRLAATERYRVSGIVEDLREFALAKAFLKNYETVDELMTDDPLTQALDRRAVERAIRNQAALK